MRIHYMPGPLSPSVKARCNAGLMTLEMHGTRIGDTRTGYALVSVKQARALAVKEGGLRENVAPVWSLYQGESSNLLTACMANGEHLFDMGLTPVGDTLTVGQLSIVG